MSSKANQNNLMKMLFIIKLVIFLCFNPDKFSGILFQKIITKQESKKCAFVCICVCILINIYDQVPNIKHTLSALQTFLTAFFPEQS